MKLDGIDPALAVFHGGHGVFRHGGLSEAGRQLDDVVSVAIPDAQRLGYSTENVGRRVVVLKVQERAAVLAPMRFLDFAAHGFGDPVHAVADAENRDAHGEHGMVARGRPGIVSGAGTTGKNETDRLELSDIVWSNGAWHHRREHLLLTDAPRDQLGVLTAEIDHDDAATFRIGPGLGLLHCGWTTHALLLIG